MQLQIPDHAPAMPIPPASTDPDISLPLTQRPLAKSPEVTREIPAPGLREVSWRGVPESALHD